MDLSAALREHPETLRALSDLDPDLSMNIPILTVKVKLTWSCNLSCTFCSLPETRSRMDRETALLLGRDLLSLGLKKVHFSGGEVLTHPEFFDIASDWAGLGLQVNLTSNGTLMGKEEIKRLEESGVHSVTLSIDSAERKVHDRLRGCKGSHKAVVRAAERIAARGRTKLRINTVISSRNIAGIFELRELIRGLGGTSWKLIPVDPVKDIRPPSADALGKLAAAIRDWEELEDPEPFGHTPHEFRQVSRGRHGFRQGTCFVPWFNLFFTPEGACYPCCMARSKMPAVGIYPAASVDEIFRGRAMRDFRSQIAAGHRHAACTRCDDFLKEREIITDLLTGTADR